MMLQQEGKVRELSEEALKGAMIYRACTEQEALDWLTIEEPNTWERGFVAYAVDWMSPNSSPEQREQGIFALTIEFRYAMSEAALMKARIEESSRIQAGDMEIRVGP